MPSRAKKAKNNNNVIKTLTFGKKKVKLGKVLKRVNTTDTTIQTKKVVLLEQLKSHDDKEVVLSYRGLSLDDLCRQLGHYNENVARDAIIEQIPKNLRVVIPSIGRLISSGIKCASTRNQFKALINLICNVSTECITSHFELLSTHVLTGLTDIRTPIRLFAFEILIILLQKFPLLCASNNTIFEQYIQFMNSQRRPTNKNLVKESFHLFLAAYSSSSKASYWKVQGGKLDETLLITQILPDKSKLYFPIVYDCQQQINTEESRNHSIQNLKEIMKKNYDL